MEIHSMKTINIGGQIWASGNLAVTHYRNGDPIPEVQDGEEWRNLKTGAWCHYNNDPKFESLYGKMYNRYAVIDERGLAPIGFRVATYYDWRNLCDNIEIGFRNLKHPDGLNESNESPDPQDSYFNTEPSGCRRLGKFRNLNYEVGWWTSPDDRIKNQIQFGIYVFWPKDGFYPFSKPTLSRNDGYYVKCIKELYKTVSLYFDDDFNVEEAGITLKYSEDMTFQDLLDLLYKKYLIRRVRPYSYGNEWIIEMSDLWINKSLQKTNNSTKKIEEIFNKSGFHLEHPIYIVKRLR